MSNIKYSICYNSNFEIMRGDDSSSSSSFSSSSDSSVGTTIVVNGTEYDSKEAAAANELPNDVIMGKPNVVIAFAGTKISKGIDTGQKCVVVGVKKKFSSESLSPDDMIPDVLPDGSITDVVEFPEIVAHTSCLSGVGGGCYPHDNKHRPLVGGISAIEQGSTACTLGVIVKDSTTNKLVALTNNHCSGLLYDPSFKTPSYGSLSVSGNNMLQPSPSDGGVVGDKYGEVIRAVALEFGTDSTQSNSVDCAISSIDTIGNAKTEILDINEGPFPFAAKSEYVVGAKVFKSGRTTGNTPPPTTAIVSKNANVNVNYGPSGSGDNDLAPFSNQIVYEASSRFTQGGDSGSAILSIIDGEYKIIGLHFAGNSTGTIGVGCHIEDVARELGVEEWNGDIVVGNSSANYISSGGICYQKIGPTAEDVTHIADNEFLSCEECQDDIESSSSEGVSSDSSVSSSSSSSTENLETSSTEQESSSISSSSVSSESSSTIAKETSSSDSTSSSSESSSSTLEVYSTSSISSNSSSSSEFIRSEFESKIPSGITVEQDKYGHVVISWNRIKSADGYIVERRTGFSDWELLAEVDSETSYVDKSFLPAIFYTYRIVAFKF